MSVRDGKNRNKRMMLRSMMLWVSTLILTTVLFFDVLIMSNTWHNEKAELLQTSEEITQRVQNAVTGYIGQMDATVSSINYDMLDDSKGYVYKLFSGVPYESNAEQVKVNHYMTSFFAKLGLLQPKLVSVYIYVNEGKQFYWARSGHIRRGYSPEGSDWMKRTIELDGQTYTRINYLPEESSLREPVVGFSRKLKNLSNVEINGNAVILFQYSLSMLDDIAANYIARDSGHVLILDEDRVVYHYGTGSIDLSGVDVGTLAAQGGAARIDRVGDHTVCLAVGSGQVQRWRIAVLSDYRSFIQAFRYYIGHSLLIGLAMILLAMIPAYIYVRRLCEEIERLEAAMLQLCGGDFSIRLESSRRDEIGSLVRSFNEMACKTQRLIQQQYQQELEIREAEYQYLQAQIDPHFIFNALQIISSMAIVNRVESIEAVSNSLARLLSYSISTGSKVITVEEELKNVRQYMVIQQTRFRDRLGYEVDVDPEILPCKIIKMVLQPIVENAISHGIEPEGGVGTIRIHGFRSENGCMLMVCDDGVGMDAEQLAQLKRFINGRDTVRMHGRGHGVGLRNIHNRLKLYYGEQYGLKIESTPGGGTTVVVQISNEGGEERHAVDAGGR